MMLPGNSGGGSLMAAYQSQAIEPNVRPVAGMRITGPALVVHATADACAYESDARALYDAIAAQDKTLEFIKADHYLTQPADARAQAADLIAAWVTSRG